MFLTTHSVLGALAGEIAPNPFIAFLLGFASHFISDMIPHGDSNLYENYKNKSSVAKSIAYVMVDAIFAVFTVIWMFTAIPVDNTLNRAWGIIGGLLPDLIVGLGEVWKHHYLKKFIKLHFYFHNYIVRKFRDVTLKQGLMIQLVLLTFLVHELTIIAY